MSIDFAAMLTDDQKRQLVESRIQQFASEAYQYSLNLKIAEKSESESQIEAAQKAIAVLEDAIQVHQAELETLSLPTA